MGIYQPTQEEVINKFIIYYPQYDYIKVNYVNSNKGIIITCPEHGDFTTYTYKAFKNNLPLCPKCRKNHINIRVTNKETFIQKSRVIFGDFYLYDKSIYLKNYLPIVITCPKHGDFEILVDDHLSAHRGCPKCASEGKKLGYDLFVEKANEKHNFKYEYPKFNYINTSQYINIECHYHGIFNQKISTHLLGYGCPECVKDEHNRKYSEKFIKTCSYIHNNKYDYSKIIYNGNKPKIVIICPIHGEFKQIPAEHLKGCGCPQCAAISNDYISSYEIEIIEFLKNYLQEETIYPSYRLKKEIDIYLPDYKLGIEVNGVYWHSHLLKESTYHKEKSDYFKELDINIFHIWEYQWTNPIKNKIVKSMLLNKIGKISNRIYARKCVIKEIHSSEYKDFCNYNHIQGHSPAQVKLGLFYNNELISCMSFGKLRMNLGNKIKKDGEWELVRFCNKLNTSVIGGASKLFKYFENNYKPFKIISYADNDYSQGKLYNTLGFDDKGITNISYSYYNPKEDSIKNRFCYRKSELIKLGYPKEMTEFEITHKMGLYRLHNSGIRKFEKIYPLSYV